MNQKTFKLKILRLCLLVVFILLPGMLVAGFSPFTPSVEAASKNKIKKINKKAHKIYNKKFKALERNSEYVNKMYKFTDITGDGIHEMFSETKNIDGSGFTFRIYSYKKGKAKCILSDEGYGFIKLKVNKKHKTLIGYGGSHANEWCKYYQIKNGKYKMIAYRIRYSEKYGALHTTAWEYRDNNSYITKEAFKKLIRDFNGKSYTLKMKIQKY